MVDTGTGAGWDTPPPPRVEVVDVGERVDRFVHALEQVGIFEEDRDRPDSGALHPFPPGY